MRKFFAVDCFMKFHFCTILRKWPPDEAQQQENGIGLFRCEIKVKQKSRLLFITSWLILRLQWSLVFLRRSLAKGGEERWENKPGIILFRRQRDPFPLERWSFAEQRGSYLYAHPQEESFSICTLPEISRN